MEIHTIDPAVAERSKYEEIWTDVPEYRNYSPGLVNVERFMSVMKKPTMVYGERLLDAGCGAGVAGLAFAERGFNVTWLDITDAGLLPEVPRNRFIEVPLWSRWMGLGTGYFDYGFCCDVMEHIAPEYTMLCAANIIKACSQTWFQIAFVPDEYGKIIGRPLHLTVESFNWWRDRLGSLGHLEEARDLGSCGVFMVLS